MQTLWNSRDMLPAYPPLREDLHADAPPWSAAAWPAS